MAWGCMESICDHYTSGKKRFHKEVVTVTFFGFSGNTPPHRDHRALPATISDGLRFI